MKLILITFAIGLFSGCTSTPPARVYEEPIEITEINPNRFTAIAKQNLFHLAKVYDLKPFLYTKKIHIQSYVIPHSHPILTLNTKYAENPQQLLATWMHEEFHWWMGLNPRETDRAVVQLKKAFPNAPEALANKRMTYVHLVICYLEYRALVHFIGEKEARETIRETVEKDKIYPWIYSQVLTNEATIRQVVVANKLLPPPLK